MPVNLHIENVADKVVARLNLSAKQNGCSLEAEVLSILEAAARQVGRLTPLELLEEVRKLGLKMPDEAADIVRKMRDERYGGARDNRDERP